jgi:hypothetical protein
MAQSGPLKAKLAATASMFTSPLRQICELGNAAGCHLAYPRTWQKNQLLTLCGQALAVARNLTFPRSTKSQKPKSHFDRIREAQWPRMAGIRTSSRRAALVSPMQTIGTLSGRGPRRACRLQGAHPPASLLQHTHVERLDQRCATGRVAPRPSTTAPLCLLKAKAQHHPSTRARLAVCLIIFPDSQLMLRWS